MLSAGRTVAGVVQFLQLPEQTYDRWKSAYGGMKFEEATEGSELETARLQKLLHDAEPDEASVVAARMPALVREHPRFGYRRIARLPQCEGHRVDLDRAYRLWLREGLKVPQEPRKQRRLDHSHQICVWHRMSGRTMSGPRTSYLTVRAVNHNGCDWRSSTTTQLSVRTQSSPAVFGTKMW